MKSIILLLAIFLAFTTCNNKSTVKQEIVKEDSPKTAMNKDTSTTPMPGSDRDEHGCIGSAGYTWSELRKECIRIFEVGIKLNPTNAVADKTTAAFVVFDSRRPEAAELYAPGQVGTSVIMEYGKKNSKTFFSEEWKLEETEKGYVLKKDSVVLYAQ